LQFFVSVGVWKGKAVESEEEEGDDLHEPASCERLQSEAINQVRFQVAVYFSLIFYGIYAAGCTL
jgi:hypothetical protein